MEKAILAFCGEEKRVIQYGEEGNVLSLIRSRFKIPYDHDIMLQKYNPVWEEWINIEPFEIHDQDKIKVIPSIKMDVQISSPCTSLTSSVSDDSLGVNILPTMPGTDLQIISPRSSSDETVELPLQSAASESDLIQSSSQPKNGSTLMDADTQASTSRGSIKRTTERVKVEYQPWPAKFELPVQNMSPQLKASLAENKFPSDKLRKHLVQVLYDAMSQYGRSPTRDQYEEVARELVKTYPVLAQHSIPSAKPYDYWKMKLSDKFRNERKNSTVDKGVKKTKVKKTPSGRVILQSQGSSGGEDSASIQMHISWMQAESKKKSPDVQKVNELMEVTFKQRRDDILRKMLVRDVKAKYPFLFEAVQIHKEFQRITGVSCLSTLLTSFTMYRDKILNFPFKDKRSLELVEKVTTRCRSQPSQEKVAELQDWAMALVPSLFKMDSSLVMGFAEEHSDENSSPYLTLVENPSKDLIETKQFYVTVEAEKFGVAKTLPEGLALLVCSYWIFDMQYPKESKDFFNFLETALLKLENIKATRSVATVIAKLNANH